MILQHKLILLEGSTELNDLHQAILVMINVTSLLLCFICNEILIDQILGITLLDSIIYQTQHHVEKPLSTLEESSTSRSCAVQGADENDNW